MAPSARVGDRSCARPSPCRWRPAALPDREHPRDGPKPGLLRQHLTAVKAAAAVGTRASDGRRARFASVTFEPRGVEPGDYAFSVGSAGSATLVLQTVMLPLLLAPGPPPRARRRHPQRRGASVRLPASGLPADCARVGGAVERVAGAPRVLPGRRRALQRAHRAGGARLQRLDLLTAARLSAAGFGDKSATCRAHRGT